MSERTRPEKRLLVACAHRGQCSCNADAMAAMQARWCADTPDLAAARALRERVELAGLVPVLGRPGQEDEPETDPDVLGAVCAWAVVAIVVVLVAVLAGRQLWLWWLS